MTITQEAVAEKLLWGLWRSIDEGYKTKYPRDVWDHFENAIRTASYTSSLKGFLQIFQRRLPMQIQKQYFRDMREILESGEDDTILDWIRHESTYMIMLVRVANQQRRDLIKEDAKMLYGEPAAEAAKYEQLSFNDLISSL